MPNTPVWGHPNGVQEDDQDLISAVGSGSVIEVKDVNAAKPAILTVNSSNDASARALKAEGMAEIVANSANNPASTGLKITNASTNANALALSADGNVRLAGNVLLPPGENKGLIVGDVNNNNDQSYACTLTNTSTNPMARALWSNGETEIIGRSTDNPASIALLAKNESTNFNARALKVEGKAEILGETSIDIESGGPALSVNNPTEDGVAIEVVAGNVNIGYGLNVGLDAQIEGALTLGSRQTHGYIDGVTDPEPGLLYIGSKEESGNISLARSGNSIICNGVIKAGEHIQVGTNIADGKIDCNAAEEDNKDIKIGGEVNTRNVILSRSGKVTTVKGRLDVEEHARIGTAANDGKVDATSDARDLKLGTDANATNNVQIGRSGKEADIKGRLDAEEHIRVGTGANDGKVDAADNARNLKLGTDAGYTNHVIIGRADRTVEITGGKIWLNAAHTFGLDLNEAGHNPGHPSIDVFISGAVEAYIDDQGIHNA